MIIIDWNTLKSLSEQIFFVTENGVYFLWTASNHACKLSIDVPRQADQMDFEDNFKDTMNQISTNAPDAQAAATALR